MTKRQPDLSLPRGSALVRCKVASAAALASGALVTGALWLLAVTDVREMGAAAAITGLINARTAFRAVRRHQQHLARSERFRAAHGARMAAMYGLDPNRGFGGI